MTCMHLACSFFYFIRKLRCNIVVAGNNCKAIFKHALRRQAQVMPFLLLAHKNQPHLVKLLSVFSAGCLCINPCCIDAAVSQYVSQFYFNGCMLKRDQKLVELSSLLLAVYDGQPSGGTAATIRYAREQGKGIICIDPISLVVTEDHVEYASF